MLKQSKTCRVTNHISFNENELSILIKKYGTPLYLINEIVLKNKSQELLNAYENYCGQTKIAYAMKANFNPTILKIFIENGLMFDVSNINELFFYIKSGGTPNKVVYNSLTEEIEEYEQILNHDISLIVVNSLNGLNNLLYVANKYEKKINVLIRINPEIHVEADISASQKNGKFGVPFYNDNNQNSDNAFDIIEKIIGHDLLTFTGFHFHLGSQITNSNCFKESLVKLYTFFNDVKTYYPSIELKILDIGGGTPVTYSDKIFSPYEISEIVTNELNLIYKNEDCKPLLIVESGRFLTAESGYLLSKIVNIKITNNIKTVILDSGYHNLLDSALMLQEYPISLLSQKDVMEKYEVNLTGKLCDTNDVFHVPSNIKLPKLEIGDYIIFKNIGSYSIVFNMPFHCQTKPTIIMKKLNDDYIVIRNKENVEDLFKNETYSI